MMSTDSPPLATREGWHQHMGGTKTPLLLIGRECKVEIHSDEDGVRLICNQTSEKACPRHDPGNFKPECLVSGQPLKDFLGEISGPLIGDSNKVEQRLTDARSYPRPFSRGPIEAGVIEVVRKEKDQTQDEEPSPYEPVETANIEAAPAVFRPQTTAAPQPQQVERRLTEEEETEEEEADDGVTELIETVSLVNDFEFGVAVSEEENEEEGQWLDAAVSIDNVIVTMPLDTLLDMTQRLAKAMPEMRRLLGVGTKLE